MRDTRVGTEAGGRGFLLCTSSLSSGTLCPGAVSLPTLSLHIPHASIDVFKPHSHIPSLCSSLSERINI